MATLTDLKGKKIQRLSADPLMPNAGDIWLNTTDRKLKTYNGTTIKSFDIQKQDNAPEIEISDQYGNSDSMATIFAKEVFVTTLDTNLPSGYGTFDVTEGEISGGL
jgi:hypothetical protein